MRRIVLICCLSFGNCHQFGRQSWLVLAIVTSEFLLVAKFDWPTITKPLPYHVILFWALGLVSLTVCTAYWFYIKPAFSVSRLPFTY